eukprot:241688-Amphidinium_carterae.1
MKKRPADGPLARKSKKYGGSALDTCWSTLITRPTKFRFCWVIRALYGWTSFLGTTGTMQCDYSSTTLLEECPVQRRT